MNEDDKEFIGWEEFGGKRIKKYKYKNLQPRSIIHTDDLYQETTWEVRREGDKYIFEFLAARHGGGTDQHEITREEFEGIKKGKITFEDLLRKYDS